MDADIALAIGQALFPKLSAFHEIGHKPLRGVWHVTELACLDRVILNFGLVSLIVAAAANDDSIDFVISKTADLTAMPRQDVSESVFWKESVGQPFGWGWVTVNQQGYCDGLLISFGGMEPQIIANVIASSIRLRRVGS
jgi:hypothetical protein